MMTVGGWILFVLLAFGVAIAGIFIGMSLETEALGTILTTLICGIIVVAMFMGFRWYYSSTESGKRAMKSQEANFNAGIERRVEVYDVEGELIKEYEGRFDVTYDDDRILFDDENGHRHIIYYSTGNVIIDELGEEKE